MSETPTADIRERVAHWVQETLKLLPHLPPLLHGDEATKIAELQRECERLRKELEELRRDHERLRSDRDEVAQALGRLMDSVQPINQIAHRLGLRRSPFECEHKPANPTATPAPGAPGPTSVPKSS